VRRFNHAAQLVRAPVFLGPANCAEGTGWMRISGEPARHERAGPLPSANPGVRSTEGRPCHALQPARGGQTLALVPALADLLDQGIARGEGGLDVAAGVRVPTA